MIKEHPVWKAVSSGDLNELMTALTDHPFLIDVRYHDRETPLFIAAQKGYNAIIEKLLEHRSRAIDTPNRRGTTPLFAAAYAGHASTVELLVQRGSKAIDTLNRYRSSPILGAAWNGHASVIETLVCLGCTSIDTPNKNGDTPLKFAAAQHYYQCIDALKILNASRLTIVVSSPKITNILDQPIDEEESAKLRYHVYFKRSLTARLLFEVKDV